MITFETVSFFYGKRPIVENLSFRADAGECLVLAGPNGVGKSTVLALAAGALAPKGGRVLRQADVGFIPQEPALFSDLSVKDNLRFFASLRGTALPEHFCLPIEDVLLHPVGKLSGGMQKRVSIVCADLGAPKLMILDEPCAGLDLNAQTMLADLIAQWKRDGRCILYTGHDPYELAQVGNRLLFLDGSGATPYPQVREAEVRALLESTSNFCLH